MELHNRAKAPVRILRRFLTARQRRARKSDFQSKVTFQPQPTLSQPSSTTQPFKIPESYAEIKAQEQALHKLHACEKPNIAAMARDCALDKTDVERKEICLFLGHEADQLLV
jgi:hypothetical protein